jgi:hypothetical protein
MMSEIDMLVKEVISLEKTGTPRPDAVSAVVLANELTPKERLAVIMFLPALDMA